ncbi:MAG: FAD-dependent oxidoreductase [Chloroflexota bacterium]|nr:FAD-dependent oxidoreductase [Chloroflexota bacterium]
MGKTFVKLFESGRIGDMELKNRVVKAPQWSLLGNRDGSVSERLIRYYSEIARGGAGLIIVEYAFVDHKGAQAGPCELGVADNGFMPGLSLLAEAIHRNGAKAALQLVHCGRQRSIGPPIKAPSRIPLEGSLQRGWPIPEELTFEEIQELIGNFGNAARRAQMAGFDMAEIHGAHGYLLSSFLSARTNKRTDAYGGSPENRMRLILEVVRDVRQKVGPGFPLDVRLNGTDYEPGGVMIEDTVALSKELEKAGINAIHISGGTHWKRMERSSTMALPAGIFVWAAEAVKKAVEIPVMASGSITTPELAEEILAKGQADFVSLGRPLFADPYWPKKAQEGRPEEIAPCIRCNDGCYARSMTQAKAIMCTVNTALGRENDLAITRSPQPKKVAVVGGGPAGMEAARVAALSGHAVTLYEKRQLGGVLNEASVPDFKADLRRLVSYYNAQMSKLQINVIREEATARAIKKGGYDAVIVAVGGTPLKLDVPGVDKPLVTTALDVLGGKARVGQKVIVVGGGMVGTETGLYLAEQGKEVTFVEILDEMMCGVLDLDQVIYRERLAKQKVTVCTGMRVESILDNGAVIIDGFGRRKEALADNVVVAIGFCPQMGLADELKKAGLNGYAVGDCLKPRKVFDAIHEGYLAAFSLI